MAPYTQTQALQGPTAGEARVTRLGLDRTLPHECSARYELRFAQLFNPGRGFAFPCDATGRVDLDSLGTLARANYFYARTVVGREFFAPITCVVGPADPGADAEALPTPSSNGRFCAHRV